MTLSSKLRYYLLYLTLSLPSFAFPLSSFLMNSHPMYIRGLSTRIKDWLITEFPENTRILNHPKLLACIQELSSWDIKINKTSALPKIWFLIGQEDEKLVLREIGCEKTVFRLSGGSFAMENFAKAKFVPPKISKKLETKAYMGEVFQQGKDKFHIFRKIPEAESEVDLLSLREIILDKKLDSWIEARLSANLFSLSPELRSFVSRYSHEFGIGVRLFSRAENKQNEIIIP